MRRGTLAAVAFLAGLGLAPWSAGAFTVYVDQYFVTASANTCTAIDPLAVNAFHRQYNKAACPNTSNVHVRKRKGANTFASEHYIVDAGYYEILNEVTTRMSDGAVTEHRAFRDNSTGQKGLPWIPVTFKSNLGKSFVTDSTVEYWTTGSGAPACQDGTQHSDLPFSSIEIVDWLGVWQGYLQDKRSGSLNTTNWHNVEVIRKTQLFGNIDERYYYGKWLNPATAQWEGIGLVKYEKVVNGSMVNSSAFRYLTDCSILAVCQICPP